MSGPGGAPSPAPRSGSMGPGGVSIPGHQQQIASTPVTPGPGPSPSGAMSQQNLNQIVSFSLCECLVFACRVEFMVFADWLQCHLADS